MNDTPQPSPAPGPEPAAAAGPAAAPAPIAEPAAAPEAAPAAVRPGEPAGASVLGSIQSLCVTVAIAVFVITFVLQAFQIPSESMENTLLTGDYLLVDKVHYASGGAWGHILPYRQIERGDIIVFRYPVHPSQHFVKRVIGLPGDRIRMVNGRVFVNEQPLSEAYVIHRSHDHDPYRDDFPSDPYATGSVEAKWWLQMHKLVQRGELLVPAGHYFVLGDNRDQSLDSRYWGFVPRQNIIGRPLIIYWSFRRPEGESPMADDTLSRFAYMLTHLFQFTRWDRTFRIVR